MDATALESLDPNQLFLMDKNYKDRIHYRRKILAEHHDVVVAVNDDSRIGPAVKELYKFLFGTYLPVRYPSMFKLHRTEYEKGPEIMVQNLVTNELLPVEPKSKTTTLLETLGRHLDDDLLLLLPEQNVENPKYVLEAYITICPSGFNPREKLGKKLRDIHGPVPAYEERLEGSMDRFLRKDGGRKVRHESQLERHNGRGIVRCRNRNDSCTRRGRSIRIGGHRR